MSRAVITEGILTGIANVIREKLGVQTSYTPAQMASAIESMSNYPEPTGTVNITENGIVDVKDYASASVNVPNSYAAGDEGKVVSNGGLVEQTARSEQITENGMYDTTNNNSVTVNVSGGGGGSSYIKIEMTSCAQQCYLYSGGTRGWAVYPTSSGAQNAETFYANIPSPYQNGGYVLLTTERPSGATFEFTRDRIGFTDGAEDPDDLPDGQSTGRTTPPEYYLNAMSYAKDKQFTFVKVPNGMARVYWTNTQASYRVPGQKSYMWLIIDASMSNAICFDWYWLLRNAYDSKDEGPVVINRT